MLDAGIGTSNNRARINALYNGSPPYTEQEANENRIDTNVNWLEGTRSITAANRQYNNAFLKTGNFFHVSLDGMPGLPVEKVTEWSNIVTKNINSVMKESPKYYNVLEGQFAQVTLHGIGPVVWPRVQDWCPSLRGVEDVIVPTRTLTSMENLDYFAVLTTYTANDLYKMALCDGADTGWNKPMVEKLITWLHNQVGDSNVNQDWNNWQFPEKVEEDFRENGGYWNSDAVPAIRGYDFYYRMMDDKKGECWYRRIVLDRTSSSGIPMDAADGSFNQFLYSSGKRSVAKRIGEILHVQFGDCSVVAPFRWHNVRSLGFMMYAPTHAINRMRCKLFDATTESMLTFFKNVAVGDEELPNKITLKNLGIMPQGLEYVTANERHRIDYNLVGGAINQQKALISESASQFTQDANTGTNKEMTATEVIARVNASSEMVGSMLKRAYLYQTYQYQEIARRFCVIDHFDCKQFRKNCMRDGVPASVFSPENFRFWSIETEQVMGNGNKMLEIAQADRLMAVRPLLDPEAQREVLHQYVLANSDDPKLANRLVPMNDQKPSSAVQWASLSWGTLMDGKQVVISEPMNHIEYVETLMVMLDEEIATINAGMEPPDARTIIGLNTVIQTIQKHIGMIAQDEAQAERIKLYQDALKNAMNQLRQYVQQYQQKMAESGQQQDPELKAKMDAMVITAQSKAQIAAENSAQKRQQKEIAFQQEQQRKNIQNAQEIATNDAKTQAEIIRGNAKQLLTPTNTPTNNE
jgi:hypothetical protein